jgi:hypothetical protein
MMRRLVVAAAVSVGGVDGAANAQQPVPNNLFLQSGFSIRFADTPEKAAQLKKLPPNKLVTRQKDGNTYYIYADPRACNCAYVGTAQAYRTYQNGGVGGFSAAGNGQSLESQMMDDMTEDNDPGQGGAPSFNDYVFGGTRKD